MYDLAGTSFDELKKLIFVSGTEESSSIPASTATGASRHKLAVNTHKGSKFLVAVSIPYVPVGLSGGIILHRKSGTMLDTAPAITDGWYWDLSREPFITLLLPNQKLYASILPIELPLAATVDMYFVTYVLPIIPEGFSVRKRR